MFSIKWVLCWCVFVNKFESFCFEIVCRFVIQLSIVHIKLLHSKPFLLYLIFYVRFNAINIKQCSFMEYTWKAWDCHHLSDISPCWCDLSSADRKRRRKRERWRLSVKMRVMAVCIHSCQSFMIDIYCEF